MPKSISTVRFDNLLEMIQALQTLAGDARAMQCSELKTSVELLSAVPNPISYVTDQDGNFLNRAVLEQETLTDGSKVYSVILKGVRP